MVFDLETTGLSAQTSRICELGAVRVQALELVDCFQSLVDPGVPLPQPVARLTGLRERDLRGAPHVGTVVGRLPRPSPATRPSSRTTPASTSASSSGSCAGARAAGWRSRRCVRRRSPAACSRAACARVSLSSLAHFFGVPTAPCHRALPDAEATAQVLVRLIGLAQELGARRVSELRTLAAPRKRRVHGKRPLIRGAPTRPGVYLFRDRHEQVLYVGRARDLRARLRSYFQGEAPAPLGGGGPARARTDRVARPRLRARGRARGAPADPGAATARQLPQPATRTRASTCDAEATSSSSPRPPTELGPIGSRRQAALAARALAGATPEELEQLLAGGPLPRLRQRLTDLTESLRYEEAARLRDRIEALENLLERLRRLEDSAPSTPA